MSSTSSSYCLQVKATPEKRERDKKRETYKKIQAPFSSWFHLCGLLCWGILALGDDNSQRAEGDVLVGLISFSLPETLKFGASEVLVAPWPLDVSVPQSC